MPSKLTREEMLQLYAEADRRQKARETIEDNEAVAHLKTGVVPTPDNIKKTINERVGHARETILSHHSYWKEKKLIHGLQALIDTAHAAYVDVCRHDAALTSFAKRREPFDDHIERTVGHPSQKDVMAFCAAAFAVIDTVRRIRDVRQDLAPQIEQAIAESFGADVCAFIKDLRKNLSHGSVVIPGYTITRDGSGTAGAMSFDVQALRLFGDWSAPAKAYIVSQKTGRVSVSQAIGEYFSLLDGFNSKTEALFAQNRTPAEQDFYDIEDSWRRHASMTWNKILVSQMGKGKNPYDYLHRFFSPEEVREVLRRPQHSREQVDFIISLRSVKSSCDDDLRRMLYELFGVKDV